MEKRWTKELIEQELHQYREMRCKAEHLRLDLEAWGDLENDRDGLISGDVFNRSGEEGMPKGGQTQDPTGRLAIALPSEQEASACKIQLRFLERRIRRVDAWLEALPNRQRMILKMFYVNGMTWGEVVTTYNIKPPDGLAREENTLRRWRRYGLETIVKIANPQNERDMNAI